MNLLSRLMGAGELLLYHDYRAGHFRDISGQGKHGTPSGGVSFRKQGLFCDGVDGYIDCGADNIGVSACSVLACVRPRSYGGGTFGRVIDNGQMNLWVTDAGDKFIFRSDNLTQASSADNSITPGTRYCLAATRDATGAATNLYIDGTLTGAADQDSGTPAAGSNIIIANWTPSAIRAWHGDMEWLVVVSRVLTPAEIQELNAELEFVPDSRVIITEIDSAYTPRATHIGTGAKVTQVDVSSGWIDGTPFVARTGAYSVSVESVNGKDSKIIECKTSGEFYVKYSHLRQNASQSAYGTLKFWLNKDPASIFFASFAFNELQFAGSATVDGYNVQVTAAEEARLQRRDNGVAAALFATATGVVIPSVWQEWKITRSLTGEFSVYLDGVLLTAASGSNPVTDNTYTLLNWLVINCDAGDKIALAHLDGTPLISKYLGVV